MTTTFGVPAAMLGSKKSDRGSMLNSPVGVWANEVPAAKVVNGNATGAESGQGSAVEQGSHRGHDVCNLTLCND